MEIWCSVGPDDRPDAWETKPLTPALLAEDGLNASNLTFILEAMNLKAARRTGNPGLRFGTFPAVEIFGDQHAPRRLMAVSPPVGAQQAPMIPTGRHIDLGQVQVIRPTDRPAAAPWPEAVGVDTVRIRFTPARGEFYGPEGIAGARADVNGERYPLVPAANAFLANEAGWLGARAMRAWIAPPDTYDGAEQPDQRSLGIVDDTCELRITVRLDRLASGRATLETHANVFSGPPDYAPDRRPFLSLADELNDRSAPAEIAARDAALDDEALDRWVEDLFERTFETVSLLNVDRFRNRRSSVLSGAALRAQPIPNDTYPSPDRAMGARDALRDESIATDAPSEQIPLPLYSRAYERHRFLADVLALKRLVLENPARLTELMRTPYAVASNENAQATTMQMPPFMRGGNAQPLTLAPWQYRLLLAWRDRVVADGTLAAFETRAAADVARRPGRGGRRCSTIQAATDRRPAPTLNEVDVG